MKTGLKSPFLAVALITVASILGLAASATSASDGNRIGGSFSETAVSITNRISDLGVFQLINTGTGTLEPFGAATVVLHVTQDRSVHPCGAGSWTNAGIRRITVAEGVLVLRELAYVCPSASGFVGSSTWTVDGPSSTGVFADARGSGEGTIDVTTHTSTYSGKLHLASSGD